MNEALWQVKYMWKYLFILLDSNESHFFVSYKIASKE